MKWTILKRLTIGYLAIMMVVIFMGGFVTLKLNHLNRLTRAIDSVDGTAIRISELLLETLISQVGIEKKYFIAQDKDFHDEFWKIKDFFLANHETLRPLMTDPDKLALFSKTLELYIRYLSVFDVEARQIETPSSNVSTGETSLQKDRITNEIDQTIRQLIKLSRRSRNEKIQQSGRISDQVLRTTALSAGLVVVLGALIAFLNTRIINRSILRLQQHTKEIAKGRFVPITHISSPPEIKELADDFNRMCLRLQELDEMKIDFISHVSHELRTPLTAIREASSMLLEGTYAEHPEKQQELLSITKQECERLIASVNRILDLSRMEGNMMVYHFTACCFKTLAQQMITKLTPIAQRKGVTLSHCIPDTLPYVSIDSQRIDQVLENLLGNALKFTSAGDSIMIRADAQNDAGDFIKVAVSDTGAGMAQAHLEKIFDKFHRIENGRETGRGTGLGLSIAKHIVSAHGGKIWAESEPEKWSTFFFTLPAA
ncbi:MAG: ATP-binding protein [Desulfobacterales bacterium]|jgi:two-component system sensor histidine kinase GlrK|nr:ATP-binding protein [Desulfobacterales bacterium]